jgi:hypothetical protein
VLRKNQRTNRGAWRINTAQAIIIIMALGCGYAVFSAYQKSKVDDTVVTGPAAPPSIDPKQVRYAKAITNWGSKLSKRQMTLTWPFQGSDYIAKVDLSSTALLPKEAQQQFLIYLANPQNYVTVEDKGKPSTFVTKADLNHLLQYYFSSNSLTKQDFVILNFYLQPGRGLDNKLWSDKDSVSATDIQTLRQCLQTKKPVDSSIYTSEGLPNDLSWDGVTAVFSSDFALAFKDFYSTHLAGQCYQEFVDTRRKVPTADPATCIVHLFVSSPGGQGGPASTEEWASASATGAQLAAQS